MFKPSLAIVTALTIVTTAVPAFAALPQKLTIRSPKQLEDLLDKVEDAAIKQGAAKSAVYGCTEKVTNFAEDNVLSAGRQVVIHPVALVALLVKKAGSGENKGQIENELVALLKQSRL